MTGLFVILAIVLVVLYFNDAWRSLERARTIARDVCARAEVQFLDSSVVQTGVRIERGGRWVLMPARTYRFEFATDGDSRHAGQITLRGRRARVVSMDLPDGGRVLDGETPARDPGESTR